MAKRRIPEHVIENVVRTEKTIELYPEDLPYPSELRLGWWETTPVHVVFAADRASDTHYVVTAYVPAKDLWNSKYEKRKPQ